MEAYERLGGLEALAAWGRTDPAAFYALFAKLASPPSVALPDLADVSDVPLSDAEWQARATAAA